MNESVTSTQINRLLGVKQMILIVKHNSLQETFLKGTDKITVRGFNLHNKFQETENGASGGVCILVYENIPQSINNYIKY